MFAGLGSRCSASLGLGEGEDESYVMSRRSGEDRRREGRIVSVPKLGRNGETYVLHFRQKP